MVNHPTRSFSCETPERPAFRGFYVFRNRAKETVIWIWAGDYVITVMKIPFSRMERGWHSLVRDYTGTDCSAGNVGREIRDMILIKGKDMLAGFFGAQTTISKAVRVEGIGVHSGEPVAIVMQPAEADTGIVFERFHNGKKLSSFQAVSDNVGPTALCTVLGEHPGEWIATIEHVMAALYAMGVDNMTIAVEGSEMPIMDGSSRVFVDALDDAGIVHLAEKRGFLRVLKTVRVESGAGWAEFSPYDGTRFEVEIDFDASVIGRQKWAGDMNARTFREELSSARTFGFMRDVEPLWARGFALGSSLENSVVISDDNRVINPEGLRFEDEFARHKTLDAVGDLAMMGMRFAGCFRSYRGGHALNAKAVRALLETAGASMVVSPRESVPFSKLRENVRYAGIVS